MCASAMRFARVWKVGVHMQRWKRSLEIIASLVLAIAFLGCGLTVKQQAAIDLFSAATSDFATVGRSEFQQSRADVTEMNTRRLELGDDSVPENLDGLLTIERTMARLAALEALQEYAQLLSALVSTMLPSEVKAASDSFVASLQKVPGVSLNDTDASTIGRVVVFGGTFLAEYKRKKAVQEVVEVAHPHILTTIELVKQDFDADSDFWSAGYRQATQDLRGAAAAAGAHVPAQDVTGQALIKGAKVLAIQNSTRFTVVSAQITQAADRLREAQQNLRSAVHSKEIGSQDIDEYVSSVNELMAIYALLRSR